MAAWCTKANLRLYERQKVNVNMPVPDEREALMSPTFSADAPDSERCETGEAFFKEKLKGCKPERLGEGSKIGKSPKVVRRGCKSFKGLSSRGSEKPLAPVQPGVAPGAKQGCTWCKRLLEDLCTASPKDLLHPLLSTCGDFPIFDPSPRRSGLQLKGNNGTDGTCPRDRRDTNRGVSRQNSLCLLVFFFPQ